MPLFPTRFMNLTQFKGLTDTRTSAPLSRRIALLAGLALVGIALLVTGCDDGDAKKKEKNKPQTQQSGGGGVILPVFSNFQPGNVVIGQASFTTNGTGAASASNLNIPIGKVASAGGAVYVPDTNRNRVLIFNALPTAPGASADYVIGQPNFTSTSGSISAQGLFLPMGAQLAGGKLYLRDLQQDRLLVYNSAPLSTQPSADFAVGQPNLTAGVNGCTNATFGTPSSVSNGGFHVLADRVIAADVLSNRVLFFSPLPTGNGPTASMVLGQDAFTECEINDVDGNGAADALPAANSMYYPHDIWSDGTRLVVADAYNNRVLIWNTFPTANGEPADVVLGQSDFVTETVNGENPSARTLDQPWSVTSNGTQLAVADTGNNRVLIWNTFPATNFKPADIVIGQQSMTMNAFNDTDGNGTSDGAPSANTLFAPGGVHLDGNHLFITDTNNNRILVVTGN